MFKNNLKNYINVDLNNYFSKNSNNSLQTTTSFSQKIVIKIFNGLASLFSLPNVKTKDK